MSDGPVAIITGAGRGIGRATAIELARRGYRLALISRTEADLRETARLAGAGAAAGAGEDRAIVLTLDLASADAHDAIDLAVQRVLERFGRLDAVVNNAGNAPVLSVEETTQERWREVIDGNLSATFYLCRAAWPAFRERGGGVIVNLSSLAARDPFPGFAAYAAAKAGINLLGLVLAREGESIGVRVHTIAPGAVETGMFRKLRTPEQFPPDQTLDPAEVARVIAQCVTGELKHTSGEVIWLHRRP